ASFKSTGVFTSDLEERLVNKSIDFAVHSLKDIPLEDESLFVIAAYPSREDSRDAFLSRKGVPLGELDAGSIIGTSSPRRAAHLQGHVPDVKSVWIMGPTYTLIELVPNGQYDGSMSALAGLKRLRLEAQLTEYLPIAQFTPAAGHVALAIQCRAADEELSPLP